MTLFAVNSSRHDELSALRIAGIAAIERRKEEAGTDSGEGLHSLMRKISKNYAKKLDFFWLKFRNADLTKDLIEDFWSHNFLSDLFVRQQPDRNSGVYGS